MSKGDLLMYVLMPLVFFLGVYGIIIAAKLKQTGWDIKGLLIVACIIFPIIGFIATLIVRKYINKRLKKHELNDQRETDIFTAVAN